MALGQFHAIVGNGLDLTADTPEAAAAREMLRSNAVFRDAAGAVVAVDVGPEVRGSARPLP